MWREDVEERDKINELKIRKGRRNVRKNKRYVNIKLFNFCQSVVCLMTLTVSFLGYLMLSRGW
jgi:hypothetical protein